MNTPVLEAINLITTYHNKPGNEVGGNLHICLDDPNYDDKSVKFCRQQARERGDTDGVKLADFLLTLTEDEREDAVDAYWNRP